MYRKEDHDRQRGRLCHGCTLGFLPVGQQGQSLTRSEKATDSLLAWLTEQLFNIKGDEVCNTRKSCKNREVQRHGRRSSHWVYQGKIRSTRRKTSEFSVRSASFFVASCQLFLVWSSMLLLMCPHADLFGGK